MKHHDRDILLMGKIRLATKQSICQITQDFETQFGRVSTDAAGTAAAAPAGASSSSSVLPSPSPAKKLNLDEEDGAPLPPCTFAEVVVRCNLACSLLRRVKQLHDPTCGVNAEELIATIERVVKSTVSRCSDSRVTAYLAMYEGDVRDARSTASERTKELLLQLQRRPQWDDTSVIALVHQLPSKVNSAAPAAYLRTIERSHSSNSHDAMTTADLTASGLRVPCRDPISQAVIRIPVRGQQCRHVSCFDLESFLLVLRRAVSSAAATDCDNTLWEAAHDAVQPTSKCPYCSVPLKLVDLYVDRLQYAVYRAQRELITAQSQLQFDDHTLSYQLIVSSSSSASMNVLPNHSNNGLLLHSTPVKRPNAQNSAQTTPQSVKRPRDRVEMEGASLFWEE